jgi:hypothetical protein
VGGVFATHIIPIALHGNKATRHHLKLFILVHHSNSSNSSCQKKRDMSKTLLFSARPPKAQPSLSRLVRALAVAVAGDLLVANHVAVASASDNTDGHRLVAVPAFPGLEPIVSLDQVKTEIHQGSFIVIMPFR